MNMDKNMDKEAKKLSQFYSRTVENPQYEKTLKITEQNGDYLETYSENDDLQNLHLTQVVVNVGGKIYLLNASGLFELEGESTNRGVSIYRQYFDEQGEIFEIQEQFHKGNMFKEGKILGHAKYDVETDVQEVTTTKKDIPLEAINTNVIWRD